MSAGGATSALLAKILAARESWCELQPAADGKPRLAVLLRRPPEADFMRLTTLGLRGGPALIGVIAEYSVDWEGFTEAVLLGDAVGASDPLKFDGEAWREVVSDRMEWLDKCANHMQDAVSEHIEKKKAAAKN